MESKNILQVQFSDLLAGAAADYWKPIYEAQILAVKAVHASYKDAMFNLWAGGLCPDFYSPDFIKNQP